MINYSVYLPTLALLALFTGSTFHDLFAQENINISAGVGIPEFVNLRVRYEFEKNEIGMSAGFLNDDGASMFTVSGAYYVHFGGIPKYPTLSPWYLKFGLDYIRSEGSYTIDREIYLNARIGREFNFTAKVGAALDAGLIQLIHHNEVEKRPPPGVLTEEPWLGSTLPSIGLAVFYRL